MSAAIQIRPVDWVAMIAELRQTKSLGEIAEGAGLAKPMVVALGRGDNHPGHCKGEQLIAYWLIVTGKTRDHLPLEFS